MAKKVNQITPKSEDITKWYTEVCVKAELMSYAQTKGFIIYRPDGYALWEEIQHYLDARFKPLGVRNVYLPSLIPESLLEKEKEFVEGFAPECLEVTRGGGKELSEHLYVRPTSECLFSDHFKDILHSYNDLPIKLNQWCSVCRWEKTTRPFLRGSEFLWQEGHTLHASRDEAREFALAILRVYSDLGRDLLAIPFLAGKKPDSEKFAGAQDTYTIEALMPDGQALQCGTTHYLGTDFMKAFDVKYLSKENKLEYPEYTSWGVSTRLLGALIMVHGDDEGLVLPPKIAPTQVVIIPIRAHDDPAVSECCRKIEKELSDEGIRVYLDNSDKTPGWKFSQYEMKGVPLRIELGPKDIQNGVCSVSIRFSGEKKFIPLDNVASYIAEELELIHKGMYDKAYEFLNSHIYECKTYEEVENVLSNGLGFAKIMSDGSSEEERIMKERFSATPRVMPFDQTPFGDTDPVTGRKADCVICFARAY